ncbi:hypothetical protein RDABS01_016471 [Bienertia sinuspersici]
MEAPHMGIMHPTIHVMEVELHSWRSQVQEPMELLVTMTMLLSTRHAVRSLVEAYIDSFPHIHESMSDRIPILSNNPPISFLIWNVQGAGSLSFLMALKEVIRVNKPLVIALVETYMDGIRAEFIAKSINFSGHTRVDADGFSGGIWIFWTPEKVNVGPINKSSQTTNATFMMKLGWRLLTKPSYLWSRVLRTKYCKGRCDLDMFKASSNASNLWKGIVEYSRFLKTSAQFADHKWVINQPLSEVVIKQVPTELLGVKLNEMWDSELGWKWDIFGEYLPLNILSLVQSCELIQDDSANDSLYWNASVNGKFIVKLATNLIRTTPLVTSQAKWDLIWSARA